MAIGHMDLRIYCQPDIACQSQIIVVKTMRENTRRRVLFSPKRPDFEYMGTSRLHKVGYVNLLRDNIEGTRGYLQVTHSHHPLAGRSGSVTKKLPPGFRIRFTSS